MPQRKSLLGQRFGRLVVESWAPGELRDGAWLCRCDCGGEKLVPSNRLTRGVVISCGCFRPKHGGKGTRIYAIWLGIIARCTNPKHKNWSDYGGRGIKLCAEWRRFERFRDDMGQPPAGATIERRDNDGNYQPGNCYWATRKAQARNTRRSAVVTYGGRSQTIAAWAEELGVSEWRLYSRRRMGWSDERILGDLVR